MVHGVIPSRFVHDRKVFVKRGIGKPFRSVVAKPCFLFIRIGEREKQRRLLPADDAIGGNEVSVSARILIAALHGRNAQFQPIQAPLDKPARVIEFVQAKAYAACQCPSAEYGQDNPQKQTEQDGARIPRRQPKRKDADQYSQTRANRDRHIHDDNNYLTEIPVARNGPDKHAEEQAQQQGRESEDQE